MHTLERQVGWPAMQKIMSTYFDRWKFAHPRPADFFDVVREVTGRGYVSFFDEVYRSSNTLDYGVQQLTSEQIEGTTRYRTTVVVRRYGEATLPIDIVTTFADGNRVKERWDGQDRRAIYVYERAARAATVQIDPDRVLLLDVNYTNNSRTLTARTPQASLKWALKWMTWLQDLMLTYAFFT